MTFDLKYVRAKSGLKKIHILYTRSVNPITICRKCSNFIEASLEDFLKKPCSFCLRLRLNHKINLMPLKKLGDKLS